MAQKLVSFFFLAGIDPNVENENVPRASKYVNYFMVSLNKLSFSYPEAARVILDTFNQHGKGLANLQLWQTALFKLYI